MDVESECRGQRLSIPHGPLMLVYAVMLNFGAGGITAGKFIDANELRRKKVIQMKPRRPGEAGRHLRRFATPIEWPANDLG